MTWGFVRIRWGSFGLTPGYGCASPLANGDTKVLPKLNQWLCPKLVQIEMHFIHKIQQVIDSGLLLDDLIVIPSRGATMKEIVEEESRLSRRLSVQHRSLLENWNGVALEVIRLFGCGVHTGEIGRLCDFQVARESDLQGIVTIGSDASGFAYLEDSNGAIYSLDFSNYERKLLSNSFDSFICDFVFGLDGERFAGTDWIKDLRDFGIV